MSDQQWRDDRPTLPEGYQFGDAGRFRAFVDWMLLDVKTGETGPSDITDPFVIEPDDDHLWGV